MTVPSQNLHGFVLVKHAGAAGLAMSSWRLESRPVRVAVKLLRDFDSVADVQRRIGRELEALLMLKGQPGVIQIEEMVQSRHDPALVMEYAGGLQSEIEEAGSLSASPHNQPVRRTGATSIRAEQLEQAAAHVKERRMPHLGFVGVREATAVRVAQPVIVQVVLASRDLVLADPIELRGQHRGRCVRVSLGHEPREVVHRCRGQRNITHTIDRSPCRPRTTRPRH